MTQPERSRRVPHLLAVALLFGACGGGDQSQEAREKQMEDYAARYGVDADVELQGKGADEQAIIGVERPGMNARVGNDIGVPDDFPDDVAVYSGLTILSASKLPNAYMLTAQTADEPDAVVDFFRKEMKAKGWTEQPTGPVTTIRKLSFQKGKRIASLSILPGGEKLNVQLGVVEVG